MAFETGFAESHTDLLAKLKTFICDTMTPSGDRWVVQRNVTTAGSEELIVRGVGSGTDQIYVGLKAFSDAGTDNYGLILNGFTGFNTALSFYDQPGAMQISQTPPVLPLLKSIPANANAIKYWFIASSRRFIIIARTGTVYHQAYLGWFLPYGTPLQYPYPLVVGGSGMLNSLGVPVKQNESTNQVHAFWKPIDAVNTIGNYPNNFGTLSFRDAAGAWKRPVLSNGGLNSSGGSGTWPYVEAIRNARSSYNNMRPNLDGTYTLGPIIIVEGSPANMWGEFDSIKHTTGNNLTSEDIITIGSDNWLVVQNVFRTSDSDIACFKLA